MRAAWFFLLLALGVCVDAQDAAAGDDEDFASDDFDGEPQEAAEPAEGSEEVPDDEEEYVDRFAVTSSKYVRVQVVFPENGGISAMDSMLNLQVGATTPVLVGFANDGDESLNITSLGMYLHSAYDHSFYIQNFTKREYGRVVRAHEEVTLEYTFACDPAYEPMVYQISGDIQYRSIEDDYDFREYRTDEDDYDFREYRTDFVNVTVDYLPAPSRIGSTMLLGYGVFFLVIAAISYRYLDLGGLQLFESQEGSGASFLPLPKGEPHFVRTLDGSGPSFLKAAGSRSEKGNPELDGLTDEERQARAVNSFMPTDSSGGDKKKKNLKKTKKKKK